MQRNECGLRENTIQKAKHCSWGTRERAQLDEQGDEGRSLRCNAEAQRKTGSGSKE